MLTANLYAAKHKPQNKQLFDDIAAPSPLRKDSCVQAQRLHATVILGTFVVHNNNNVSPLSLGRQERGGGACIQDLLLPSLTHPSGRAGMCE